MTLDKTTSKVIDFIEAHRLLIKNDKPIIVGFSGGADSTFLLLFLHSQGYNIVAAHCNFNLRGDESKRDQQHAAQFAKQIGVKFETIDFDTAGYCSKHPGISLEQACRDLRFAWFESLRLRLDGQAIAVGHNSDDNIETTLFNLQRGTGLAGLRGIPLRNNRHVVHPILCVSRDEIEMCLNDKGLHYVTDSTNRHCNFDRNKLRNIVIPTFIKNFPNLKTGITTTINNLAETETLYRQLLSEKLKKYTTKQDTIDLSLLATNEPNASLLLYEWFRDLGLTRSQSHDIISSYNHSGATFMLKNYRLAIDRGHLQLIENQTIKPESLIKLIEKRQLPIETFAPERDPFKAYFSPKVLEGQPLKIRFWQKGDRFKPFGLNGSKKISDIFNDAKISASEKRTTPILAKGDELLWIIGIRQSALYPISADDTTFIEMRYKNI